MSDVQDNVEAVVVPPFTLAGFMRAFRRAAPMALGVGLYGVGFGIMAVQAKFSVLQATLMSALMFSGSAQLASVGVLSAGYASVIGAAATLFLTILVMNARYFLFSAALYPHLRGLSPLRAYGSLALLGDGGWLMTMQWHEDGNRDAAFLLGSSVGVYAGWVLGTLSGAFASNLATDPRALGLDFFLVAFAAAMFGGMFRGRSDLSAVVVAVPVALIGERFLGFGGAIVLAGLSGALAAFLRGGTRA